MSDKPVSDASLQPQLVPGLLVGVGWNQEFIGELLFPPTPTTAQRFFYETWGNEGLVDEGQTKRGLHAHSKILHPPKNGTQEGTLVEHSSKMPLDVNVIQAATDADRAYPLQGGLSRADQRRQANMMKLVFNEKIQREKEVAGLVFDATKYDSGLQTTAISFKTCTITDLKDRLRAVQKLTGFLPDTFVLGYASWTSLYNNDKFLDRINGGATATEPAVVTDQLIARLIGVKNVYVGIPVIQPKTAPGVLPASSTALWTDDAAAFIYVGDIGASNEMTPAFGKMFYMNVPGTSLRYGAWSWLDDEPNTIEWQKIAEYRLTVQTMQAGYHFTNTDQ